MLNRAADGNKYCLHSSVHQTDFVTALRVSQNRDFPSKFCRVQDTIVQAVAQLTVMGLIIQRAGKFNMCVINW